MRLKTGMRKSLKIYDYKYSSIANRKQYFFSDVSPYLVVWNIISSYLHSIQKKYKNQLSRFGRVIEHTPWHEIFIYILGNKLVFSVFTVKTKNIKKSQLNMGVRDRKVKICVYM